MDLTSMSLAQLCNCDSLSSRSCVSVNESACISQCVATVRLLEHTLRTVEYATIATGATPLCMQSSTPLRPAVYKFT
eukprot:17385-Heterococcus_DN1.PRE.1